MKKVKFPLIKKQGTNLIQYPDEIALFSNTEIVGNEMHADYSGQLPLEEVNKSSNVINIIIGKPTNTKPDFNDNDTQYTVAENQDSIATGSGLLMLREMGYKKFTVPFFRIGANKEPDGKRYMVVDIAEDGTFSATINFKTGGEWIVNSELLNSELTKAELKLFKFQIEDHKFKVV